VARLAVAQAAIRYRREAAKAAVKAD